MSFLQPAPPPFDLEEWRAKPYLSRIKANCQIHDAATGLLEEGWVGVAEMLKRGPWLEESFDFPVRVTHAGGARQPIAA